jgi:hypothetical protein
LKGFCIKELLKKGLIEKDTSLGSSGRYRLTSAGRAFAEREGIVSRQSSIGQRTGSDSSLRASTYFQSFPGDTREAARRFFTQIPRVAEIQKSPHKDKLVSELTFLFSEMADRLSYLLEQARSTKLQEAIE